MRAYLEDLKNNHPADACALLTAAARTQAGSGKSSACGARMAFARAFLGQKGIARLEAKLPQEPIAISGDRATAPPLTGSGGSATFVYRGGRWLIGN